MRHPIDGGAKSDGEGKANVYSLRRFITIHVFAQPCYASPTTSPFGEQDEGALDNIQVESAERRLLFLSYDSVVGDRLVPHPHDATLSDYYFSSSSKRNVNLESIQLRETRRSV